MLFQSVVPSLFQRLNFQADSQANLTRKLDTAKRLDFYHDEQLDHLEVKLSELFSDPSTMVKVELNIVKKVINNLTQVYREPPIRIIEGSEKDQKLYAEIIENCFLDVKLKQASRYTKLLKTILLRPVWRNDGLELDILTGNLIDVETGESPEDLQHVLVTDFGKSDRIEDVHYSLWNAEEWKRLDYRGNVIEASPNPYKILPFLPAWDRPPTSSAFFIPGGQDLISLQEAINLKLTDLIYLMSCQSFGVGYIKGTQGGGSVKVDPGSLVELPENGSIGFESQKAEIRQVVEAIDKLIKWGCVANGLSAASMSTDASEASGLSKLVDKQELDEMRQDDIMLWRGYEKQLFKLMRIVWNTHATHKLSESATLSIDFADPQPETDAKTQVVAWDTLLALGVISPVDIAMERNPDLKTREDALTFLLQVQAENNELNSSPQM
jgi:hypothetical protein